MALIWTSDTGRRSRHTGPSWPTLAAWSITTGILAAYLIAGWLGG